MNKEYLKSIKFIQIDYTEKINNIGNYYTLISKAHNPKYFNVVFSVNFDKLNEKIKKELKNILSPDADNKIFYFNKDNFIFYNKDFIIPINRINDFLNAKENDKYECNICFELFDNLNICHSCNFKSCNKCLIENFKNKNKGKINGGGIFKVECVVCGTKNGNIELIMP